MLAAQKRRTGTPVAAATKSGRGASEAELAEAEAELGFPLPAALRVQYRFCDGQELQVDATLDAHAQAPLHPSILHGLFGGYLVYDHIVRPRPFRLATITWRAALLLILKK